MNQKILVMGFSGCRIYGHSGTDNKPRKPYFNSKKYTNATQRNNQSSISYNSQPVKVRAEKPYREPIIDKLIKYGIKLPFLLFCTSICFIGLRRYFMEMNGYSNQLNLEMTIIDESEKRNAYRVMTDNGYRYLKFGQYRDAQIEFSNALNLIEGNRARVGLYTALSQQCILEGVYCEEAAVNLNYLKQMNYVGVKNKVD